MPPRWTSVRHELDRDDYDLRLQRGAVPRGGEIHLWRIDLAEGGDGITFSCLSNEELQRSKKFLFSQDRNRFLRAKHAVRAILGRYLEIEPREINIGVGSFGKPYLCEHQLKFNLSHSYDIAFMCIGLNDTLGVDVEVPRFSTNLRSLASSIFSKQECDELAHLSSDDFTMAFFRCWTAKEAVLKAIGTGLSIEPRAFSAGSAATRRVVQIPGFDRCPPLEVETVIETGRNVVSLSASGGWSRLRAYDFNFQEAN